MKFKILKKDETFEERLFYVCEKNNINKIKEVILDSNFNDEKPAEKNMVFVERKDKTIIDGEYLVIEDIKNCYIVNKDDSLNEITFMRMRDYERLNESTIESF